MKKNALIALSMIMLSVFSMTFTSCSSDDDDAPVLTTPKYAENAVRYQINGTSEFSSIEFTEDGMYVITKAEESSKAKGLGNFLENKTVSRLTRSSFGDSDMYIHGKYTNNGDVYTLEGFGTVTVEKTDGKISLKIQPTGKKAYTLSAYTTDKLEETDISDKLCRTWKFKKVRATVTKDNNVLFDKTSTKISEVFNSLDSFYHHKAYKYTELDEITFTKSGTQINKCVDNTISVQKWRWTFDKNNSIYYAWDEIMFDGRNILNISFDKNNDLVLDAPLERVEGIEHITYYLSKTE